MERPAGPPENSRPPPLPDRPGCGPIALSKAEARSSSDGWRILAACGCAPPFSPFRLRCQFHEACDVLRSELHPDAPATPGVVPMDGSDVWPRTSPDERPAVYVTHDAGESWVEQRQGLPERGWFTVKRQAMTTDRGGYGPDGSGVGVYFGTTGGEVWASLDGGDNWSVIAQHLPEIYAIECGYATGADAS